MRTIIVSVIGISSLFLTFVMQQNINQSTRIAEGLEDSLSLAMNQTMTEMMERNDYEDINNQNEWMAIFLQAMIRRMEGDVDLTVKVYQFDCERGRIDVEVTGCYRQTGGKKVKKSVRRKMERKSKKTAIG